MPKHDSELVPPPFLQWALGRHPLWLVFLVAVLPRALLGLFAPYDGLDWPFVYRIVAENIFLNHCVSQSPPLSAVCAPHWGGNQLPGFPAFVALAWLVSGKSNLAVLIGQSILTGAAICRLAYAAGELANCKRIALAVGLVTALSPLCLGWARSLNTEALALATTIWVLAELFLSLARQRLRIWSLGVALACAAFVRLDNVLLCFLVVVCAFAIHRPGEALRRGAAVAAVFAVPLLVWTARSVAAGLPLIPSVNVAAIMNPDGTVLFPTGMKKYYLSWLANATDQRTFSIPVYNGTYREMHVPDHVFDTEYERDRVHLLLSKLAQQPNTPIPKEIDDEFGAMAAERYARNPLRQIVWLPLSRLGTMWINPFYSWGLPIGLEKAEVSIPLARQLNAGGAAAIVQAALDNPVRAIGKAVANGYLMVLIAAFLLLPFYFFRTPPPTYAWTAFLLALTLVLVRSLFLVSVAQVETRYIAECVPAIEAAVILGLASRRRNRSNGEGLFLEDPEAAKGK
jgi:hypothetical protein